MDTSKNNQAAQLIAKEIAKIPANTPNDYGTLGALIGRTKRESEAYGMAKYFVSRMGGKFTGKLYEDWTDEERQSHETAKEIAAAAIAITGK